MMQEKCPVCGKIISANENKCSECGFTELHKTFISKIDAEEWIEKVVKPYIMKYQEEKNINKIQTLYMDIGTYTGEVLDGKRHGYGIMKYSGGDIYEGEFQNDKLHGHGKYIWANGETYVGKYKDGLEHGHGKYTWPSGETHDGEFQNGKKHGHGKHIWPNGDTYEGDYQNGEEHGHGKYTWSDGNIHEGEYQNGQKNGHGKYTYPDGKTYEGNYKNDKRSGYGITKNATGDITYKGEWENGEIKTNNQQSASQQQNDSDIGSILGGILVFIIICMVLVFLCSLMTGSFEDGFFVFGVCFIVFFIYLFVKS